MNHQERRLYVFSGFWGVLSFFSGFATIHSTLPASLVSGQFEKWRIAAWVWLNAHEVLISQQPLSNNPFAAGYVDLISAHPKLQMLRVLPLFTSAIACLLLVNSMNGVSNDGQLVYYGVHAAGAYMATGVLMVLLSNARPATAGSVLILVALGVAGYLGSAFASTLKIPVFAITSLGGIVGIGLLALLGFGVVATVAVPIGKYSVGGMFGAIVALWIGKNIELPSTSKGDNWRD